MLLFAGARLPDLDALKGAPLERLVLDGAKIADYSGLRGLPLRELRLKGSDFHDLSLLAGMPLKTLDIRDCPLSSDLSPLIGLTLDKLDVGQANIDTASIAKMSLKTLYVFGGVLDLRPLAGSDIDGLGLAGATRIISPESLREMPQLRSIYYRGLFNIPPGFDALVLELPHLRAVNGGPIEKFRADQKARQGKR